MANCKICGKKVRIPLDGCCKECYNKLKNEQNMVLATDATPEFIENYKGKYAIILDIAIVGFTGYRLNNLVKAINRFAEKGWKCVNITSTSEKIGCYALMERLAS